MEYAMFSPAGLFQKGDIILFANSHHPCVAKLTGLGHGVWGISGNGYWTFSRRDYVPCDVRDFMVARMYK